MILCRLLIILIERSFQIPWDMGQQQLVVLIVSQVARALSKRSWQACPHSDTIQRLTLHGNPATITITILRLASRRRHRGARHFLEAVPALVQVEPCVNHFPCLAPRVGKVKFKDNHRDLIHPFTHMWWWRYMGVREGAKGG